MRLPGVLPVGSLRLRLVNPGGVATTFVDPREENPGGVRTLLVKALVAFVVCGPGGTVHGTAVKSRAGIVHGIAIVCARPNATAYNSIFIDGAIPFGIILWHADVTRSDGNE